MKSVDLLKTSLQTKNILILDLGPEATLAYVFPDALVTFTFAYGSRSQSANVPLRSFWRRRGCTTLRIEKPQRWDTINIELKPDYHPIKRIM